MKRIFLIVFALLGGASALLYWTAPDRHPEVPVLYWITQNDETKRETIRLFKEWRKERGLPPVDLRIDNANQDPTKKLAHGLAGVGADIFDIYKFETELFASSGMLLDITEPAKARGFSPEATYPALRNDLVVNGRQYGFPRNAGAEVTWFNREAFARYGIPEPNERWTWDEFEQIGTAFVNAANPPGTRERSYFIQSISPDLFRRGLGLSIFNETMTASILDDPRNAEVMRRIYRWFVELRLVPTRAETLTLTAASEMAGSGVFYLFHQGRFATLNIPRYAFIRLRPLGKMSVKVVEPPHSGFPNMEFSTGFIAVYAGTKYPEEAMSFQEFLTSAPFNELVISEGDSLPPVPKFLHSEKFLHPVGREDEWHLEEFFSRAAPSIGISLSRSPFILSGSIYRLVTGIESAVVDGVLAGQITPEEAGRIEQDRINDEIARNVAKDASLRALYERLSAVQKKIDARKAEGRPIPAAWITNPFHLAYYRAQGLLEEEGSE
ncbi:MAG: ABC transporter substrate-binding protein [Cephaloticoccus sp.]